MNFLADMLATYRLTRLITEDRILDGPRALIERRGGPRLRYFVSCPWCVSIWVGAGVATARRIAPRAWAPAADALAASAVAGLISENV